MLGRFKKCAQRWKNNEKYRSEKPKRAAHQERCVMINLLPSALEYFAGLLATQDIKGLGVRMRAVHPGTAKADCKLEFCESEEITSDDYVIECAAFNVYIDQVSMPFLADAELSYQPDTTGGALTIKAPKLKMPTSATPGVDASILERVQYVIDQEINPSVASHGGRVSVLELRADGAVVLQFGGGCQGCGMKDVTLKQGVEKTLLQRVPELSAVIDATDHAAGANPYFKA
jgi:Fe/S biogenesis protein NfuA